MQALKAKLADQGFVVLPNVLSSEEVTQVIRELDAQSVRHGMRNLVKLEPIHRLVQSKSVRELMMMFLSADAPPVRSLYFDKTPEHNWPVSWHQDRTIAVRHKRETEGFTTWTLKDGVPHVQPPAEFMAQMVTTRIHLDGADESNGALRVIPGSHKLGYLTAQQIRQLATERPAATCSVAAGSAVVMNPLILHSSRRASTPSHRRVIHLEYTAQPLPDGLRWAEI